jgi:hypothetical protein
MWEVFSLGDTPYRGMTNAQAKLQVLNGKWHDFGILVWFVAEISPSVWHNGVPDEDHLSSKTKPRQQDHLSILHNGLKTSYDSILARIRFRESDRDSPNPHLASSRHDDLRGAESIDCT